jgi:hypothetical protein
MKAESTSAEDPSMAPSRIVHFLLPDELRGVSVRLAFSRIISPFCFGVSTTATDCVRETRNR